MPDETAESFLSSSNVSVRVGKILSTRWPYCILGTAVPYVTFVSAVDKGALGMGITMRERPVLGPTQDRATRRVTFALVMCLPNDSHSGVLWHGHSPCRKSNGSDSSRTTFFMSRFCFVRSILQSIFIGRCFMIETASHYQNFLHSVPLSKELRASSITFRRLSKIRNHDSSSLEWNQLMSIMKTYAIISVPGCPLRKTLALNWGLSILERSPIIVCTMHYPILSTAHHERVSKIA
jgi:hypothetical protein